MNKQLEIRIHRAEKGAWKRAANGGKLAAWIIATLNKQAAIERAAGLPSITPAAADSGLDGDLDGFLRIRCLAADFDRWRVAGLNKRPSRPVGIWIRETLNVAARDYFS